MVVEFIRDHQHSIYSFKKGQKTEVTRELGASLLAAKVAIEIKPAMLDTASFNLLMSQIDKKSMIKEQEEEE